MMNGINQQSYLANMMAYSAANGGGMAASPGATLGMHNMPGGSPRSTIPPAQLSSLHNQLRELEANYRAKYANQSQDQIHKMATEQLSRIYVQQRQQQQQHNAHLSQSAMNAAAGATTQQTLANGMAISTSPHQHAERLLSQQSQQGHGTPIPQAGQHQRQSSGSLTPGLRKANGE